MCSQTLVQSRQRTHGGLTPPALVLRCERPPAKKRFLECTNAHPAKSGGREPAVLFGKRTCNTDTADVRGHSSRAETRAAGVSPPWAWVTHLQRRFRKVAGDCRRCAHERRCSVVRFPRLVYASRSWLQARTLLLRCVSHPRVRDVHHGSFTPPAPGCERGRCCCCAFRIRGYVTHTTARLRQLP